MNTWQSLRRDPSLWQRYFIREKLLKGLRRFFEKEGFHEVETPILVAHPPAESYVDIFATTLLDRKRNPTTVYLSTSPEVALKKCLVAGLGDCFSITKSFRNTEIGDPTHAPEFTILEWYRAGAGCRDIMEDCEHLLLFLLAELFPENYAKKAVSYAGQSIDLTSPWTRISMKQAFRRFAGIDLDAFMNMETARTVALKKGYAVSSGTTWEELFNQVFLNEVEPKLPKATPVFLYDFPSAMGALAKTKAGDSRYADRFELYIAGLELADCYAELTDWKEQKLRFDREIEQVKKLGKTPYAYDMDFIEALKAGLPDCSGIALGIDRLLMIFMNVNDIKDTQLLPL